MPTALPSDESADAEDVEADAVDEAGVAARPRPDVAGDAPPPRPHGQSAPAMPHKATQLYRCANHIHQNNQNKKKKKQDERREEQEMKGGHNSHRASHTAES